MSNLSDYKRELSALQFTAEQKARLAQTVAEGAGKQARKRRRPVLRTALIAAAMAVVLAVGSSAAAGGFVRAAVWGQRGADGGD